jgi:hypothetical protein
VSPSLIGSIPPIADGMSMFIYGHSETGCRTMTMICTATISNLDSLVIIAADTYTISSGIGVAAFQFQCSANASWQIDYEQESFFFEYFFCFYAIANQTTTIDS